MTAPQRAEPQTFRGRSITVSITANDFEKSFAWYTDVVGFTLDRKYERDGKVVGAAIKGGSVNLSLAQDDGAKGVDRKKAQGMRLYIATAQDIDELAAAIKERGGKLDSEPADMYGVRSFNLVDPDGVLITISSEREG